MKGFTEFFTSKKAPEIFATNPAANGNNITELVLIIDRSGSMGGMEDDTIGGINAVLQKNKQIGGECTVSILLFDNEVEVLHDRVNIANVKPLTRKDYSVRGCTALLDAVGGAVEYIKKVQGYMPQNSKADHVVFVITTDGMENASRNYTYEQVKRLITAQQEAGWEFLFLGANIDAAAEACNLGIAPDRAATFVNDSVGSKIMYDCVAEACCEMRTTPKASRIGSDWSKKIENDFASR